LRTLKDLPKRISFSRLKEYLSTCLAYSFSDMDYTFLNECDRLWDAVYTTRIPEITKINKKILQLQKEYDTYKYPNRCAVLEERLEEIDDEIEIEANKQILRLFVKYYKENPKNWIKIKKP
jgi:predicted nuclease with TOPRIM domain